MAQSAQRRQFARKILAGLPVIFRGEVGIGKDERPGGEQAEHFCTAGAIVAIPDMSVFLPDRRGIGVISRGLRTEDAEVDRDQDGAETIFGFGLVCLGQADPGGLLPDEDRGGRAVRRAGH
jgi:hypothetical protein